MIKRGSNLDMEETLSEGEPDEEEEEGDEEDGKKKD